MDEKKAKRRLIHYIRKAKKRNIKEGKVREALIKHKWDEKLIDEAYEAVNNPKRFFRFEKVTKEDEQVPEEIKEDLENEHKVSLSEKVDEINKKLDAAYGKGKKKQDKMLNLPYTVKSQLKHIATKDKVLVFYLTNNRTIRVLIAPIRKGFIVVDGKPHNCSTDFVFMWKGKYPAIVLPEWDLNPIGTVDYYEAMENGRNANAAATVIHMIEAKEQLMKKEVPKKMLILGAIGAIIVIYVLFGQG